MKVISIGPNCDLANIIENKNLRYQAYPFDFITSNLYMIKHCINDEFKIFLDKKYFKEIKIEKSIRTQHLFYYKMLNNYEFNKYVKIVNSRPSKREIIIMDEKIIDYDREDFENFILNNRPIFYHHNLLNKNDYDAFLRRCNRFMDIFKNNNTEKTYLIYFNRYCYSINEILDFCNFIKNKKNIFFIAFLIKKINNNKKILYEKDNCIIYENYNYNEILEKII